jgi:pyridoxine kinase
MQVLGVEVDPINTVQFSNSLVYPHTKGLRFDHEHVAELFSGLVLNQFSCEYSHVLTGYIGRPKVVQVIHEKILELKANNTSLRVCT